MVVLGSSLFTRPAPEVYQDLRQNLYVGTFPDEEADPSLPEVLVARTPKNQRPGGLCGEDPENQNHSVALDDTPLSPPRKGWISEGSTAASSV